MSPSRLLSILESNNKAFVAWCADAKPDECELELLLTNYMECEV